MWSVLLAIVSMQRGTRSDRAIDKQKAGLKSVVQYFSCYLKGKVFRQYDTSSQANSQHAYTVILNISMRVVMSL